jgi:hypothetical protein
MAAVSASDVSRRRNTRANAEAFMKTKTIASALGLLAAATLLVADGAHAGCFGGDHHYGRWGAAEAAAVAAKAAARAAYDAHDPAFLHRCYQPQRIWNGARYTWQLFSIC